MSSTFETLPDEILMIILKYSGDVHTILRTFLGLNQRLNRILIDKRLHLFIDFLSVDISHISFDGYYNSVVFHQISHELSIINGTANEQQLLQCFQLLIAFHLQEQYKRSGDKIQSDLAAFEALRQRLINDEIIDVDNELSQIFNNLRNHPININDLRRIEFLVIRKGACLQCSDDEGSPFNLAMAINDLLHSDLNNMNSSNKQLFYWKTRTFKALILSNPRLLANRDYIIYNGCTVWFFLFYAIYRTHYYRFNLHGFPVNMKCYQAVVDLLFFAIQCQKLQANIERWSHKSLLDILNLMPTLELVHKNGIFIENVQREVLEIITDIYISTGATSWQDDVNDKFQSIFGKLVKQNRVDVILFIYRRLKSVRHFFNQLKNCRTIVDTMTGSQTGRQLLKTLLDEKPLENWINGKDLIFVLLQKKERKLLEKLLKLSPFLVHQLDENGNNLLLYVCLKVRGCRHRLVELLITMKSDLQRKNFNGENFFDVIRLERNRELVEKLNTEQII